MFLSKSLKSKYIYTPILRKAANRYRELQWLEHLWNHANLFETGVVRANEC